MSISKFEFDLASFASFKLIVLIKIAISVARKSAPGPDRELDHKREIVGVDYIKKILPINYSLDTQYFILTIQMNGIC